MEKFELHQNFYKEPSWNGKQINPLEGNYQKEYTEYVEDELLAFENGEIEPSQEFGLMKHGEVILESLRDHRKWYEDQKGANVEEILQDKAKIKQINEAIEYIKFMIL